MRYDITGEHRSAYDRRACRTDETPAANLDAARAGPAPDRAVDAGVLRAAGYCSGARRADRGMSVLFCSASAMISP